jgi:hypothetical protein
MTPEQENDAVMEAAILGWVMDALAGNEVCDFATSFVEVAAAMAVRDTLERVARGCLRSDEEAEATLMLLGNFKIEDQP